MLLEPIGFYSVTPVFIFCFLLLAGEKSLVWAIGLTVGIYCLMLLFFARVFYLSLPVGNHSPFYDFSNWLLVFIR